MIAIQGPRALELLDRLSEPSFPAPSSVQRATMAALRLDGLDVIAGRTGYTGEDGMELYFPASSAEALWTKLLEEATAAGIEAGPIGLAARDSLRFEAGMPLHGHEITAEIRPQEALLNWACDFDKEFVGKAALLKLKADGLKRKLVTLTVTGGVPREGYAVRNSSGEEIGACVCGMFCPTVEVYAANAFVPPEYAKAGTPLKVLIRNSEKEAIAVKRPIYVPVYRRSV
jgi:glycine cleavage system aminomethyltransferase T